MACKLTTLCTDILQDMVTTAYSKVAAIRCHEGNRDSYDINSLLVANTTSELQTFFEDKLGDYQLPQNIRSVVDTLEEKLEKVALQNINNEMIVNNEILKCNEEIDRELLKDLLMDKVR